MNPLAQLFLDPTHFSAGLGRLRLRGYQKAVAQAVLDSVVHGRGRTFVVMFPRQSGKNELQAQIEALLLALYGRRGGEIIKVSPTWRPQSLNAMRRLERVLENNLWFREHEWTRESGHIYRAGRASLTFLSGAPEANIVGATASLLLEVDEAQDVGIDKYDKEIAPMAASSNATRVLWGTAWTSQTLLGRELRAARAVERAAREAGEQPFTPRAFVLTAEDVAAEVPAYGQFVAGQVARLGRGHPMVRTQFYSEEIDGQGGLFPPERLARMRAPEGSAAPRGPQAGRVYALLLDIAGVDLPAGEDPTVNESLVRGYSAHSHSGMQAGLYAEGSPVEENSRTEGGTGNGSLAASAGWHARRDATALTVVEVDRATLADPLLRAPTYRVVERRLWVGRSHARLFGELRGLAESYQARWVVVDATGVGAGLASFLARALPGRVIPFTFSLASKSRLGWDFISLVDQGRWVDAVENQEAGTRGDLGALFFQQAAFCQFEILPGPGRLLRWGVPDGTRDPASGRYIHDDLLISAALCSLLDRLEWPLPGSGGFGVVRAADPLDGMGEF